MTPIDFFFRAARRYPERIALDAPDRQRSYRELAHDVNAFATALQAIDPEPGSRVVLIASNTIEHVTALLAILAAGKVWVPIGYRTAAPEVARCCLSHGRWDEMDVSFDELLVALADNLWKGKRNEPLERRVVEGAASLRGGPFWDLFVPMDSLFESIAAGGEDRLARSV